jgi:hypothetical protein
MDWLKEIEESAIKGKGVVHRQQTTAKELKWLLSLKS